MPRTILLCTVGGSASPIRTAIRTARPDFVRFLVTAEGGPDGGGSRGQAEKLAAELGLADAAYDIHTLPADDPDAAGILCDGHVAELRRRWPNARLVCDYTGGTKSMSAALMLAGIKDPQAGVVLQLMKGDRRDLEKVADGTERPVRVAVDALLAERALDRAARLWASFGYAEAAAVLAPHLDDLAAAESVPAPFRERLAAAAHASEALAAWDRFDHAHALRLFRDHALDKRAKLGSWLQPLRALAHPDKRQPLLLLDLWHNALRRAARGQYDDAVARCYRLVEATAQHLLASRHRIDTDAVDLARLPERIRSKWEKELGSKREAGLAKAWRLFLDLDPDHPAAQHLARPWQGTKPLKGLDDWIALRNRSLLAHGFDPLGRDGWDRVQEWMQRHWLAMVWPGLGCALDLPQLPNELPAL